VKLGAEVVPARLTRIGGTASIAFDADVVVTPERVLAIALA